MINDFSQDEMPTAVEIPHPTQAPPAPEDAIFGNAPLSALRQAARALLAYAVDIPRGARSVQDPIYRTIVEGRSGAGYSSCGDLAHWLLYTLGVRAPWINRAANAAAGGWRMGANLNALVPPEIGPNTQAFRPSAIPAFDAGDIYVIMNRFGGHVICVRDFDPATGVAHTSEYGQPGGATRTHTIHVDAGHVFSDANQIISALLLPHALGADGLVSPDAGTISKALQSQIGA